MKRVAGFALACLTVVSLGSCSIFRFGKSAPAPVAAADGPAPGAVSDKEREADLLKTVQQAIDAANAQTTQQREAIEHRSPYFFKAYDVYAGNAEDAKIVIQEKDSHSLPYVADVTLEKQRFTTRLHRKRADAARDSSFLRETGVETVTYEFRNGRWKRSGSLFVAEKTEAQVNGEWAPVTEDPKQAASDEENEGWFSRAWSLITGS